MSEVIRYMLASSSSSRNKVVKGANGLLSQVIESITDHEIKNNVLLLRDIQSRVEKIKEKAHGNANKYADFLETEKHLDNNTLSINDFVINKIYEKEHSQPAEIKPYTYWMNGGFSRNYHIPEKFRVGHLDIRYAYQDTKREGGIYTKIENIYHDIIIPLQTELSKASIATKMETTHFKVENDIFTYEKNINVLFRPPFYSIKLIYEKRSTGGKKTKKNNGGSNIQYIDNLTIVEFHFEFYFDDIYKNFLQNLKRRFILPSIPSLLGRQHNKKLALNKLNEAGVIAFSYLYPTNKSTQYGFDIDKEFRDIFLKKRYIEQNLLKAEFYKELLKQYKAIYPEKTKAYNLFLVENIETMINSYSAPYYDGFVDFINKWVISMFRPAINAFIKQINEELQVYGVKLFIAGGDAMRRYSNDISFSKDIDTKLYIANIYNGKSLPEKKQIKQDIIDIITRNIVKLKFYIERNLLKIFDSNNLKYTYQDTTYMAHIVQQPKTGSHQLRTREIRNNGIFPVDLYSIDFRIKILVINNQTNETKKYNYDISLLDVVLQDNEGDDYNAANLEEAVVPYASLEFLVKDFLYTYYDDEQTDSNNPRAMARISSGKYKKDIQRATCMMHHYIKNKLQHSYQIPKEVCLVMDLDFSEEQIEEMVKFIEKIPKSRDFIYIIEEKIKLKKQLNVQDMIKIRYALPKLTEILNIPVDLKRLLKYLNEFIELKTNIFYEDIYSIDNAYATYSPQGNYYMKYLQLFQYLCNSDISIENKNKLFYNDKLNDSLKANINDNTPLQTLHSARRSYSLKSSSIFLDKMHSSRSVIKKPKTTKKHATVVTKQQKRQGTIKHLPPIPEGNKRSRGSDMLDPKNKRANTRRGGGKKSVKPKAVPKAVPKASPNKQNAKKSPKIVKK
jgi:hypothetical protein